MRLLSSWLFNYFGDVLMEQKRNHKGLKKYEPLLHAVCVTDDYYKLRDCEWEGCLGVACAISVIEGIEPNLLSISRHLDIPYYDKSLQNAFDRLRVNGIFSSSFNIRKDYLLTGNGRDYHIKNSEGEELHCVKGSERERNAWCNVAGIASGFIGIKIQ
jgi:hypothetical protein